MPYKVGCTLPPSGTKGGFGVLAEAMPGVSSYNGSSSLLCMGGGLVGVWNIAEPLAAAPTFASSSVGCEV